MNNRDIVNCKTKCQQMFLTSHIFSPPFQADEIKYELVAFTGA